MNCECKRLFPSDSLSDCFITVPQSTILPLFGVCSVAATVMVTVYPVAAMATIHSVAMSKVQYFFTQIGSHP